MGKRRIVSLRALAGLDNPFESEEVKKKVERTLTSETSEGRFLEWKLNGPFNAEATKRTKYRTVKAIISFANTVGGFIVFGVRNDGKWVGLADEEFGEFDPGKITELVNGCISPGIMEFSLCYLTFKKRKFVVLHVPPSRLMPHVTTKEVIEQTPDKKRRVLLAKYAVYCRYGGKSDVGRPNDYQRIVTKRTDVLREAVLRRFKEVTTFKPLPIAMGGKESSVVVRVAESSKDKSIPVVTLSRKAGSAAGTFLHEALSEGLFDEINNVLNANELLAKGRKKFFLGREIYYRIYAERQHVDVPNEQIELLAWTGFEFYGPVLYWLLRLPYEFTAEVVRWYCDNPKHPNIYSVIRLAILLGADVSGWLGKKWDKKWEGDPQPPECYFAFNKMQEMRGRKDRILVALRAGEDRVMELTGTEKKVRIKEFLKNPKNAANFLSEYCVSVFEGNAKNRDVCRQLDLLAYGREIEAQGGKIAKILIEKS